MKIGIITATNGKRPLLLSRCIEYVQRQTIEFHYHFIMPEDTTLKEKYRRGIESLKDIVDIIFFFEDDDYYPRNYLEKMLEMYEWAGKPEVFGIGETYFYHPDHKAVWYYKNPEKKSCAFSMCIRSDAVDKINWNQVDDTIVDAGIWRQLQGETVTLENPLCIGIKHGRGKTLASGHNRWFYDKKSQEHKTEKEYAIFSDTWLREKIGDDAEFYEKFGINKEIV